MQTLKAISCISFLALLPCLLLRSFLALPRLLLRSFLALLQGAKLLERDASPGLPSIQKAVILGRPCA